MRRKKFTTGVIEQIPRLIGNGKSASEIAKEIGCTVSTLRVRCSQLKISLRRMRKLERPVNGKRLAQLTLLLSPATIDRLRQQAKAEKMTDSQFASALIETIARDNLYKAVLDRE